MITEEIVEKTTLNQTQFAMFMWANMFKQSEGWSWFLKGKVTGKMKMIYNQMQISSTRLLKEIEKHFNDSEAEEIYDENSEVFSRCLELIFKAKTIEEKQELFLIMKEYSESKN